MSLTYLFRLSSQVITKRILPNRVTTMLQKYEVRKFSSENDLDRPLAYIGSDAAKWKAEYSRKGRSEDRLWYEPYVVAGSTVIFLLYFCVFREENDIDEKLTSPLFINAPGVEKPHLLAQKRLLLEQGKDVSQIQARLDEIEANENIQSVVSN